MFPCARCVSHTGNLVCGCIKGEARGSSRYQNNSRKVIRNMENRNVETTPWKILKRGLISAKDQTIKLPERCA